LQAGKKGIAVSAGATYQNHDDLRSGGSTGVQRPSGYSSYAADGKLFLEGNGQDLLLNIQYLKQPKTPRFDELVPGFGQVQPGSSIFLFEPNDRLFLHGRYRFTHPLWFVDRLQLNLSFQQINDDRRTRDFGSALELRERNRSSLTGFTVQLTSRWQQFATFTYGSEIYLDKIKSSQTGRNIETGATPVQQSRFADGSTLNSFAVYAQSELRIHSRLTVTVGGRLTYFEIAVSQADRGIGVDLHLFAPTGSLGLTYHLRPGINLVANVGRAFRVPNVLDLSTLGERPGNRFNIPSPNLSPENAISVDGGVKMEFSRFSAEAFGFHMKVHDKIEAAPTGAITPSGRQIVQSGNINTLTLFGAEIGGRLRSGEEWEWFGSLTYTQGEEKGLDGRTIPADRIPPFNGQAGFIYRPLASLWGEVFVRFATSQKALSERDLTDPRINPNGTAGWVTANVRLGWEMSRNCILRLAAENLFDQGYREHGSGINAAGRSLIATLEAVF
jgi:outer membrane receptor protein involved in Fe transport